jgi:hypothetical protein
MKRQLLIVVLSGLVATFLLEGNARACHKRSCGCQAAPTCVTCAPARCAPAAPVCEPACAPRKHCGLFAGLRGFRLGCHRRAACAEPVATPCATVAYSAPVIFSAPVGYTAPTIYSSPQASVQH